MRVQQPFVIGWSQVGGIDGLGDIEAATLDGIASTLAVGTLAPAKQTHTLVGIGSTLAIGAPTLAAGSGPVGIAGIASTLAFGTIASGLTEQPFTVDVSQVGGLDRLGLGAGSTQQRNLVGIPSTLAVGVVVGPRTLVGIPSTLALGVLFQQLASQPFTVDVSQVGGPDALGVTTVVERGIAGIPSTLAFGSISGGARQISGIASTLVLGVPTIRFGLLGDYGFADFGDGTFGGDLIPLPNPSGDPFTIDQSLVGGTDQVGGQDTGAAAAALLGGIASTLVLGAVAPVQASPIAGVASTLALGDVSIAAGSPVEIGLVGIESTLAFGGVAGTVQVQILVGIPSTLAFGRVTDVVGLVGIPSTLALGVLSVVPAPSTAVLAGIESTLQIGAVGTVQIQILVGIPSTLAFGVVTGALIPLSLLILRHVERAFIEFVEPDRLLRHVEGQHVAVTVAE